MPKNKKAIKLSASFNLSDAVKTALKEGLQSYVEACDADITSTLRVKIQGAKRNVTFSVKDKDDHWQVMIKKIDPPLAAAATT